MLCHYLIYHGNLPIGHNASAKLNGLTHSTFSTSTDYTRAFRLVKDALHDDEYSGAVVPDAIYFAKHDNRSLTASFDATDFKQRLLVLLGSEQVRIFRLPELAKQAVHLGNEIAQAVTMTVSAKDAIFEGLSPQAVAVLQNGGIVIRITRDDRCSIVARDHHTTVGLSAGIPWAQLLALILHGHAAEALHPSKAPHLAQHYKAAMCSSFTAKADEELPRTAARWQEHFAKFDASAQFRQVKHQFCFCKCDPSVHPPQRPNPGKVGEQFSDAIPASHKHDGTIVARVPAAASSISQRVTFVYAEARYISEVWVEQDPDDDEI